MKSRIRLNRLSVGKAADPGAVEQYIGTLGDPFSVLATCALPKGFPIPFDRESGEIHEIIFCHLVDHFLPVRSSANGKAAYARAAGLGAEAEIRLSGLTPKIRSAEAAAKDLADFDTYLSTFELGWFGSLTRSGFA